MGSALHRSVNRPEPNELAYSDRSDNLNVNTDLPYQAEVETATKAMTDGKAQGVYSLQAELLAIHETNLIPSAWNPVDLLSHLQGLYFADYLTVMSATLVICRNNSTN